MKRNPLTLAIGVLLLVVFFLLLFVFQVRKTEVAVVTTFSEPRRNITEPGAYLKWPWPVQRVYKFDQRIQDFEDDRLEEVFTADNFNLMVRVYVGWRVTDPIAFFPKFPGDDKITEAEKTLKSLVRNAKNAVSAAHPFADLVNPDPQQVKFLQIEKEMLEIVRAQVKANDYGLSVEFLGLKRLGLPDSVTAAVFERMKSERELLASTSQYDGEREAGNIRSDAEYKAAELLAAADAEARRIRGEGEQAAARSLEVFQRSPALANFLFRLEALEGSLTNRTTLIFDQHTAPFDLFGPWPVVTNIFSPR